MTDFLTQWHSAALTSIGFFWMALWAFILGYFVSSVIQVLVTRQQMQQVMGEDGPKSMLLGTFFGFISSSCSFSALATTKTLFKKGAGLAPSMAFLLASTNLVIELGMVIAVFLSWQFVFGEYVGGILLILICWLLIKLTRPKRLIEQARQRLDEQNEQQNDKASAKETLTSQKGWQKISMKYYMEWQMVWKDVLIGFTVAGIISAFVPTSFFEALFIGVGSDNQANPGFLAVLTQAIIAPFAAFFTFIGSMGNIPLAAVLFNQGVAFAGVMAFIFSDLVVLPVLRINAKYYGWKMALYQLSLMLTAIIVCAVGMHYALLAFDALPSSGDAMSPEQREFFKLNYQFYLNIAFLVVTTVLGYFYWQHKKAMNDRGGSSEMSLQDKIMLSLSLLSVLWLLGGLAVPTLILTS
ncbi:MAG: permease [Gammaproteobacteria bacterium]|nr:permease [Gammaproteobacteria bacterium]